MTLTFELAEAGIHLGQALVCFDLELKLEAKRAPVEVIVIDRVERMPVAN